MLCDEKDPCHVADAMQMFFLLIYTRDSFMLTGPLEINFREMWKKNNIFTEQILFVLNWCLQGRDLYVSIIVC